MNSSQGTIYLVGAGPGDPGLITVRGFDLLRRADLIVHDRLIGHELLAEARPGAEIIDTGKEPGCHSVPQERISAMLIDRARQGAMVVRLKGGDPCVFGRGFEEMTACREAGIDCVVIPGVTSAFAAPTAVGIPITSRHHVRSLALIAARAATDSTAPPLDYQALAGIDTVCVLMGREKLRDIARSLIEAGRDRATPAACVEWATTPRQRLVVGTLETIADESDRKDLRPPVVTVIGRAAAFAKADGARDPGPLAGKRIVVTRPCPGFGDLRQMLSVAGAVAIPCVTSTVEFPSETPELDQAIRRLEQYSWTVFTSVHGVRGFWTSLSAMELDARVLGACKVAAIGPRTPRRLRRQGIRADVVANEATPEVLFSAMRDGSEGDIGRILYPCGVAPNGRLTRRLSGPSVTVDHALAYRIAEVSSSQTAREFLDGGVDAVVFCSPAALERFVRLGFDPAEAIVACVGRRAADAARSRGLEVDVVACEPAELVDQLSGCFAAPRRETA